MNQDWDSATKIGSRAGRGGSDRETVIRGKAALNAATRSGASISTEKKYASANSTGGTEGQRLTKVDRSDEIVKPKTVGKDVGKAIEQGRQKFEPTMTQAQLGKLIGENVSVVNAFERGTAAPDQGILAKMERQIKVKLRGKDIGAPLGGPKKK